jgi:hypothetical protein
MTQTFKQQMESLKVELETFKSIYTQINEYAKETHGVIITELLSEILYRESELAQFDYDEADMGDE